MSNNQYRDSFVSDDSTVVGDTEPIWSPLERTSQAFEYVEKLFRSSWSGIRAAPPVTSIIEITMPGFISEAFEDYGNLHPDYKLYRAFHGTYHSCALISEDSKEDLSPCSKKGCCICNITREGFKVEYTHLTPHVIWLAQKSSMSNIYSKMPDGGVRAMLVCDAYSKKGPIADGVFEIAENASVIPRYLILYQKEKKNLFRF